jgi:predicted nucleic acid-binding protein
MQVLADTSIWIDHFRRSNVQLAQFLDRGDIVMHPFVIGELALGKVANIAEMIDFFNLLPKTIVASAAEILGFISKRKLSGSGIGYVDVHLLAAAALMPETLVWTRDKKLRAAAQALSLVAEIAE